jgi:hypothetical protein
MGDAQGRKRSPRVPTTASTPRSRTTVTTEYSIQTTGADTASVEAVTEAVTEAETGAEEAMDTEGGVDTVNQMADTRP